MTSTSSLNGRQIMKHSVVLMLMTAVARFLGFFVTIAIARHYGAAELGAINLAQQLGFQGLMVATCGLELYAVKHAIEMKTGLGSVASTVILLRLVLSVLIYGLVIGITALVPALRPILPLVSLFALMFFTGALSLRWVSQATHRTHVWGLSHLAMKAAYLGLAYLVISGNLGSAAIPVAFVAAEALVALGLWMWMRSYVEPLGPPMAPRAALRLLKHAAPIGGSRILRSVAMGSDLILLGLLLTLEKTGWYSAAFKIYTFGIGMLTVYFVVLFPNLVRRATESLPSVWRAVRRSLLATCLPCAAFLLAGGWIAEDLLEMLFGPSFATAGSSLSVLMGALLVVLISGHLRHTLIALGRQRQDMQNVLASSVIHIAAKLALIPVLGIVGSALGTLLGELILMLLAWRTLSSVMGGRADGAGRLQRAS